MNDEIGQLALFDQQASGQGGRARRSQRLDPGSEALLQEFEISRRDDRAAASTARHEAGQLRSLCRAVGTGGHPLPVMALLQATDAVVDHLSGRGSDVSRTTNQARLRALGRFVDFCAERRGMVLTRELEAIYEQLPRRRPRSWNHTGVVLGGARARRTPSGKTMHARDLPLVVMAGPQSVSYRAVRDRALLVCTCFTGLRLRELAALCWEQLEPDVDLVRIRVRRGVRELVLSGYGDVPTALGAMAARGRRRFGVSYSFGGVGAVFRQVQWPHAALSERQAFTILKGALVRAGFPRAGQRELRRAFVHWLTLQGLSDHEAILAAGIRDVRTLDALLERVRRLNAQRVVVEFRDAGVDEDLTP